MNVLKKLYREIMKLDDIENDFALEVELYHAFVQNNHKFSGNLPIFILLFAGMYSFWLPLWYTAGLWGLPIFAILLISYKINARFKENYDKEEVTRENFYPDMRFVWLIRGFYMLLFSGVHFGILLSDDPRLYVVPMIMVCATMAMAAAVMSPYPRYMVTFMTLLMIPMVTASIFLYGELYFQIMGGGLFLFYLMVMKLGRSLYDAAKQNILQKRAIAEAKNEAEEASRAKSQFLATMSHEVRTPLNGILGMANLLRDTKVDGRQAGYLDTIKYSGETLLTMLNDILDYSKMEAGKFEIEKIDFDLNRVVKSVADILRSRAEEKGVAVKVDIDMTVPDYINSDPTRLRQVLLNLVSNGIKFTDEGSVTIYVKNVHEDGDTARLRFDVVDTGIGIPESARQRLFKEFSQVDSSTSRKYGGTGLGLSICQQIVELMEGEIGADSVEGEGSTFWFEIDVDVADYFEHEFEDGEGGAKGNKVPQLEPLHILVVDDNQINLQVASDILAKFGHETSTADSGQAAIDMVQQAVFDVILMDMQMPGMNGLEATREIKAMDSPACDIPVIALTANNIDGDDEVCIAEGMVDHVPKPFEPHDLLRTIARHVPHKVKEGQETVSLGETKFSAGDETEGVDLSTLHDLEDMFDRDYVVNFLQTHMVDIQRFVTDIETEGPSGDIEIVKHRAHELKSLSAMFGLSHLSQLAAGIERCCMEGREEDAREMSTKVSERYVSNLNALQKFYPVQVQAA